jgi:hypothetical protein
MFYDIPRSGKRFIDKDIHRYIGSADPMSCLLLPAEVAAPAVEWLRDFCVVECLLFAGAGSVGCVGAVQSAH